MALGKRRGTRPVGGIIDIETLRLELRVGEGPDNDLMLMNYGAAATHQVEQHLSMPLQRRLVPHTFAPRATPITLSNVPWFAALNDYGYWTANDDPNVEPESVAIPAGMTAEKGFFADTVVVTPPDAGWPADATAIAVVFEHGPDRWPNELFVMAAAAAARDIFESVPVADRYPLWKRFLEPYVNVAKPSYLTYPLA